MGRGEEMENRQMKSGEKGKQVGQSKKYGAC